LHKLFVLSSGVSQEKIDFMMYFKGTNNLWSHVFRQICHWTTFTIIIYSLNDSVSDVKYLSFTMLIDFAPAITLFEMKRLFSTRDTQPAWPNMHDAVFGDLTLL